ncbi:hypothetical protein J3R30DRAFT_3505586 [Lentinula aciculospora]|uniref:Uncharacterized protein n=1 Tax=Lentinula aciculospora TaxID=153920 RepID=A0A9W9DKG6_9AGAR|nr:hypothetical protein J3R30DRAFT_3505586 [Lentinula aciculospora]
MLKRLIPNVKLNGSRALRNIIVLAGGSALGQRDYQKLVNDTAPGEFFYNSAAQAPPAVQNILRKFEALGSRPPEEASLYSQESIEKHVSPDIRKYTRVDERDITLKDLRMARRLHFQNYIQTKMDLLDPSSTRRDREEKRLRFMGQAVARWHSLTLIEKLDIASSVRQRRLDSDSPPIGPPRRSIHERRQTKRLKSLRSVFYQIKLLRANQAWRKRMRKRRIYRKRRSQPHSLIL